MLQFHDVRLTCCDIWLVVDVDDCPLKCPVCKCLLKWGFNKTDLGPYPYIITYRPRRQC